MTRFLSEALQAVEPYFRQGLARLEAANGHPAGDIRLSSSVIQQTKFKMRQLGLDPEDTTAEELYHVLEERVKGDDQRLVKALRMRAAEKVSLEANVADGLVDALQEIAKSASCYGMRYSALKSVISSVPPKRTMKQLGYRSLASMLKHEQPVAVLAAAWLVEGSRWQSHFSDQYKKLKPKDFENRKVGVLLLDGKRWRNLAAQLAVEHRHNLLSFKELGSLVLLPFTANMPAGSATISLALALHELNEIRAASTFLKLSQVRPNFGQLVQTVVAEEPRLSAEMLDRQMPWHLVQRYYAHQPEAISNVFEPQLQAEDLSWQAVEQELSRLEPSFEFWHDSGHLALLHNHKPVSLNLIDVAINFCNHLPFEQRLMHYFQRSLWQELFMNYLQPETVERAVGQQLQPQLEAELAEL